ncbi:hypothetical protein [Pelomonas sp. SE-A7]|uniref:hypothetical protein n=1 Tax=Pelomonas sp. SE-A7 TaxID=3054953 RepID=UPI00259D279E|nr:hypothetical protein [Pelomonas sp. SE-A7]MDM4767116.1 hypothetical protein [Pelomonas sp. SE-A7]
MKPKPAFCFALALLGAMAQAAPPPRCLAYAPAVVSLGGRLEKLKAPQGEARLVLVLQQPICMTVPREEKQAGGLKPLKQVGRVLVETDARRTAQLEARAGQRMALRGRLSPAPAGPVPLQLSLALPG